jgi:hypothetical protein
MAAWFISLTVAYAAWYVSLATVAYLILLLWIATGWPEGDIPARTYYLYLHRVVSIIAMLLFGPVGLIFAGWALRSLAMLLKALRVGFYERPDLLGDAGDVVTISRSEQPGDFWNNATFDAVIALLLLSFSLAFFLPLGDVPSEVFSSAFQITVIVCQAPLQRLADLMPGLCRRLS